MWPFNFAMIWREKVSGVGINPAYILFRHLLCWMPRYKRDNHKMRYEQPLVSPQLMHFKQVPFRTNVNCLQF